MGIQVIAEVYRGKTDDELLELTAHPEQLTSEALNALTAELATRRLNSPADNEPDKQQPRREQTFDPNRGSRQIELSGFLSEVFRLYQANALIFLKIFVPATLVMYLTTMAARSEVRALTKHLFSRTSQSPYRPSLVLELSLINLGRPMIIWLISCLLFAATCSAVDHINSGLAPKLSECFVEVGQQLRRFLGLSSALFFLLVAFIGMARLLNRGAFWFAGQVHIHLQGPLLWSFTYGLWLAALIVEARFSLALPAVLLDDYPVGRSILLSDRLTEGKWLILMLLVLKSSIGGYIGAMLPFWIRMWLRGQIQLPYWCAVAGSIAAVATIEPPMFIGFALLYLKLTETSTTPGSIPRTQLASEPTRTYS